MDFILKNWWYLLLVGGMAFMMFRGGGCCGGGAPARGNQSNMSGGGGCCGGGSDGGGSHGDHGHLDQTGGGPGSSIKLSDEAGLVRDPVCGMTVDPATAVKQNLDGQTYYFCSEACRTKFVRKHRRPMMGG